MAKKGGSEEEFMALARFQREEKKAPVHAGMVMTHPPVGPSKSLDEVLAINTEVTEPVAPSTAATPVAEVPAFLRKPAAEEDGVVDIPIDLIQRSPFQVRTMGNDDYITSLAESIQYSGQISPVIVRPVSKPGQVKYEFVAGEHRALALKQLGYSTVKSVIKQMSDQEAALALTSDNTVRKDIDDLDRFKHLIMLKDSGACKTNRDLARALKIHPSAIPQLESFGLLKPETIHLIEEASMRVNRKDDDLPPIKVGMSSVYSIRELAKKYPDTVHAAFEKVCYDKLPQKGIVQWVESHFRTRTVSTNSRRMEIYRPGMKPLKIKVTDKGAELIFEGINIDKLYKLLEDNIVALQD